MSSKKAQSKPDSVEALEESNSNALENLIIKKTEDFDVNDLISSDDELDSFLESLMDNKAEEPGVDKAPIKTTLKFETAKSKKQYTNATQLTIKTNPSVFEKLKASLSSKKPLDDDNFEVLIQEEARKKEQDEEEKSQQEKIKLEKVKKELEELKHIKAKKQKKLEDKKVEAERVEAERVEAERLEAERIEEERIEEERIEEERIEEERIEAERVEAERIEAKRIVVERIKAEILEEEKKKKEIIEAKRDEEERVEAERIEASRIEAKRIEAKWLEEESIEAEKVEAERVEAQRVEVERIKAEILEGVKKKQERIQIQEKNKAEYQEKEKLRLFVEKTEEERHEKERELKKLKNVILEKEHLENEMLIKNLEIKELKKEKRAQEQLEKDGLKQEQLEIKSESSDYDHSNLLMELQTDLNANKEINFDLQKEADAIADTSREVVSNNTKQNVIKETVEANSSAIYCGNNEDILDADDLGNISYKPENYMVSILLENHETAKRSGEVLRLKIEGVVIIIDYSLNTIYCNVALTSDEYRKICRQPILPHEMENSVLDYAEVRKYKAMLREKQEGVHSINRFIATTSLITAKGRLPEGVGITERIVLKKGVDTSILDIVPHSEEIIIGSIKHAVPMLELSTLLKIPQKHIFSFYNVALNLDLLNTQLVAQPQKKAVSKGLLSSLFRK